MSRAEAALKAWVTTATQCLENVPQNSKMIALSVEAEVTVP
jgi:hypothetical protein